ncbi:hypothetical protein HDU76_002470 [Blyttiomyces sp. JEL0837]|nr:hypothetical protein HDU76_002470 [Blyttiomyces sp. JEL0837]
MKSLHDLQAPGEEPKLPSPSWVRPSDSGPSQYAQPQQHHHQQQNLQSMIPWLRKLKYGLIIATLIAVTSGSVAIGTPWYDVAYYSGLRFGFFQQTFDDGSTATYVCSDGTIIASCIVSLSAVVFATLIGLSVLIYLVFQIWRPRLQQKAEKRTIIITMVLLVLSASFSYTAVGVNWLDPYLAQEYGYSPDIGFGFCIVAGIFYTGGLVVGVFWYRQVSQFDGRTESAYAQGPVYVLVAGQNVGENTYVEAHDTPQDMSTVQQQGLTSKDTITPVPVYSAPDLTTTVSDWLQSKGYDYTVIGRFKKLYVDGPKMHALTFQSLENELYINDLALQARILRDIQGLRPTESSSSFVNAKTSAFVSPPIHMGSSSSVDDYVPPPAYN